MKKLLALSRGRKGSVAEGADLAVGSAPRTAIAALPCGPNDVPNSLPADADRVPSAVAVEAAVGGDAHELERLYAALCQVTSARHPRTFKLIRSSKGKISQKVIEEAGEVALEAVKHHAAGVIRESADLLYHLVVLWRRAGVEPARVWNEMRMRADAFGIAEKLPKGSCRAAAAPGENRPTQKSQGEYRS